MPKPLAPIVLFVFSRPEHTRQTLESLAQNFLASDSDLIIYADAARNETELGQVKAVRAMAHEAHGFHSVTVIERETNYGLARNIIEGVTEVCSRYGRLIVLEDDMVTSPYFLTYMNNALNQFADDERVASIHGYVYPVKEILPEAFFIRGADCWGWATWSRAWRLFNPDGRYLLQELKHQKLTRKFDYDGAYPFTQMLAEQIKGSNNSWAIRWYASAFLADKLTLYPGRSLVRNIGHDSSGTHCKTSSLYETQLGSFAPDLTGIEVCHSKEAASVFEAFFRNSGEGGLVKYLRRIRQMLPRLVA